MQTPNGTPALILVLALAAVIISGCSAPGQSARTLPPADVPETPAPILSAYGDDPIENGRITYRMHCASCHGREGRGDGPVAEVLLASPADLTALREANDGVYPFEEIYRIIDGREEVSAHATREMPVWGNIWAEEEGEPVSPEVADLRIRELVEYIRSIQADP